MRSRISHQGVRDGVSSLGRNVSSRRIGGKLTRRGEGGVTRSRNHNAGKAIRAVRSQGDVKAKLPNSSISGALHFGHQRMKR